MRGGGRGAWGLASGPTLSHSCRARPEARHCSQGPLGAPLVLESDVLRGVHRARGGSNQSPWRGQGRRNPLALLPGRTACSSTCGQRNQVNHRLYSETDGCGCLRSLLTWASRSLPALSSVEMASLQGGRQFEADLGSDQRLGMHTLTLGGQCLLVGSVGTTARAHSWGRRPAPESHGAAADTAEESSPRDGGLLRPPAREASKAMWVLEPVTQHRSPRSPPPPASVVQTPARSRRKRAVP